MDLRERAVALFEEGESCLRVFWTEPRAIGVHRVQFQNMAI
jgi:hypothetical protein